MRNTDRLLLAAQAANARMRLPPVGEPPSSASAAEASAWRAIVEATPPGVLRQPDEPLLELSAAMLAAWRADPSRTLLREMYRALGTLLIPMPARRRLLFGD